MSTEDWDIVIVGAGSAGCVLAERLTCNPNRRVLLLEGGGSDRSPLIHMPKGIGKLSSDPKHTWFYPVGQPRVAGEKSSEVWVRGKGLGGSSSTNGMIWIRGHPADYEAWQRRGCAGWGWSEMLEAFQAIEDHELGLGGGRGVGGPVHVSTGKFRYPLAEALIAAGEGLGLPRKEDLNSPGQEGIGYYAHNIKNGRRQSAAVTFLRRAQRRPNLRVVTGALVDRIRFDGQRASAVDAIVDGHRRSFRVRGEVVLSAGVMGSPAILQRSGVGPGSLLASLGIAVVADRAGVGMHLKEHLGFGMPYRLQGAAGLNREFRGLGLVKNVLRYGLTHGGPMATGPYEVGGFVRSQPGLDRPDMQLFGGAFTFKRAGNADAPVTLGTVEDEPGFTLYSQLLRLESEGRLAITGSDPTAALTIEPNWLSTPADQTSAVAAVRYTRRLMSQPSIARYLKSELVPGPAVQTDEEILAVYRRLARCGIHGVGVCRMGGADDDVCDSQLRVRGVTGVRVIDASVMPGLISGNTNAPTMALAWHAARLFA